MAVLLSLMIGSSAEDFKLYLSFWRGLKEIKIESDVLLDNVKGVIKQLKVSISASFLFFFNLFKIFSIAFTQCDLIEVNKKATLFFLNIVCLSFVEFC